MGGVKTKRVRPGAESTGWGQRGPGSRGAPRDSRTTEVEDVRRPSPQHPPGERLSTMVGPRRPSVPSLRKCQHRSRRRRCLCQEEWVSGVLGPPPMTAACQGWKSYDQPPRRLRSSQALRLRHSRRPRWIQWPKDYTFKDYTFNTQGQGKVKVGESRLKLVKVG